MKPIEEVYPEEKDSSWFLVYDYQPLLDSFGYEIILQVDDDDYQGDSRLLFRNGDLYGLLMFGWGSCSGCDALQACSSYAEVDQLRQELLHDIKWMSGLDMLNYIQTKDWELEWSWHREGTQQFIEQALQLLEGIDNAPRAD